MSNQTVGAALSARLNTLGLPTQWENAPYTPSASMVYLQEALLPADAPSVGIASSSANEFTGIYQVSVLAPAGGTKGPGYATAKQVQEAFPKGLRLTRSGVTVAILRTAQGPAFMDGARWVVPVSIYYRALA